MKYHFDGNKNKKLNNWKKKDGKYGRGSWALKVTKKLVDSQMVIKKFSEKWILLVIKW